ncbi:MAG: hypothetical protein AB7W16_15825 [Candidatus Obscuribacterales bacterium]
MSNECSTGASQGSACAPEAKKDSGQCCQVSEKLLCLADEAWKEVLKAKMVAHIEKQSGAKLDKLAALVTEANHKRWAHMIQGKQGCDDFQSKVKQAMFDLTQE